MSEDLQLPLRNQPLPPFFAYFPIYYIRDHDVARHISRGGVVKLIHHTAKRPSQPVDRSFIVLGDLYRTRGEFHKLMLDIFDDLCKAVSHTPTACGTSLMFDQDVYNKLRNIYLKQIDVPEGIYAAYAAFGKFIAYNISILAYWVSVCHSLDAIYLTLMHELLHIVYGHCEIGDAYMRDKFFANAPRKLCALCNRNINFIHDAFVNSSMLDIFRRLGEAYYAKGEDPDVGNLNNLYLLSSDLCKFYSKTNRGDKNIPVIYKAFNKYMITKDKLEKILKIHGIIEIESNIDDIPMHVIMEKVILKTKEYYEKYKKEEPLETTPLPPSADQTAHNEEINTASTDRERVVELRNKLGYLLSTLDNISDSEVIRQAAQLFQRRQAANPYGLSSSQRKALQTLIDGLPAQAQHAQIARGFAQASNVGSAPASPS